MAANNMTVVRDALKLCGSRMCRLCKELELARSMLNKRPLGVFCHPDKCTAYQAVHAALALPLRQCDVGTATEQGTRLLASFEKWREDAAKNRMRVVDAVLNWAQMPYNESEAGKDCGDGAPRAKQESEGKE